MFLGSGDAFGSGGRLQTCFLLTTAGGRFLIDCGATALSAMRRFGVEPNDLEAIVLSHLHGDHYGGLPFFILDAQLMSKRTAPLTVAGPRGAERRLREAMEALFPGSSTAERRFRVEVRELEPARRTPVGSLAVIAFEVRHPSGAPALALRIEIDGKTVAYSGDTEWTEALIDAARGADLFIAEAYFYDKRVPYHLDYRTLREHLHELGAKRVVLTHMSDDMLGRVDALDCECAEDGKVIVL